MILTLTPNPTIDRTIFVRGFRLGATLRGERETIVPSGKGIGGSLVIRELGGETVALGLSGGITGDLHAALLDARGIKHAFLPAQGETRTLVVLVDTAAGQQSSISAPTLRATEEHLPRLIELVARYAGRAWGLICGGSLPPGMPGNSYVHLLRRAREQGLVTLLDTSGQWLQRGIEGRPHILKINRDELESLDPNASVSDAALAASLARRLGTWASDAVIVTLGERGALAVTSEGVYRARPPEVPVVSNAGAGDALGGAIMLARSRGEGWPAALRLGTAAAAAVVMTEGTAICRRAQMEALAPQVEVVELQIPGI